MKILQAYVLQGPNYWSIRRGKLIVIRLDLEELAETPSDRIPGFYDGLVATLPSLEDHFCSPGCRGGFLSRVREGTLMGHILEHVALELQTLAQMPVGFGRTRETATPGIYQVVVEYQNEEVGRYAVRAALRLCRSIIESGSYPSDELAKDLEDMVQLRNAASLGASTDALVREAQAQGIPWTNLETCDLIQFGYGKYQKRLQAALTSHSNVLGVELACDKERTKKILTRLGVPVPLGRVIYSFSELAETIEQLGGYPIVIKPLDGNHGRGISIDIQTWAQAEVAYDRARDISKGVIVEHYYTGRDHRILVVNHKVIAVAERVPAHVIGNGLETIAELVDQENRDARRGEGHDNILTQIQLDAATDEMLSRQGFTLDTVLAPEQLCYLRATANLSTGGIAIDRTDEIHPETVWLAERVSRIIDLDVAGIDVITTDITKPLKDADGVVVEVNAAPGLRMHVAPSQGVARNVAAPILQMLFPPGKPHRMPIVAVTGTNGKTTTTRLIAHLFSQVYEAVGYTTTDGIYIGSHLVEAGDTTGPQSAQMILQDPTVDMAVLETARGGILRSGLAFDCCDVAVVLNVAADHLGLGDIDTIEQMARLKAVVAETVTPEGYAVLNADDERVAAMASRVLGKVAYFSMDGENERVRAHVRRGGIAAVYESGYLVILQQDWVHRIEQVERVPLTLGGRAPFMIANALAACLVGFVQGLKVEQIRSALRSFVPSHADLELCQRLMAEPSQENISSPVSIPESLTQDPPLDAQPAKADSDQSADLDLDQQDSAFLTAIQTETAEHQHQEPIDLTLNPASRTPFTTVSIASNTNSEMNSKSEPVVQDATFIQQRVLKAGKKLGQQVLATSKVFASVAVALSRVAITVGIKQSQQFGARLWKKFEKATQLVDPKTLDPALSKAMDLLGKDGEFSSAEFIFRQTQTGIDVYLKDGTPMYIAGTLNSKVDGRFRYCLSQVPAHVVDLTHSDSHSIPTEWQKVLVER